MAVFRKRTHTPTPKKKDIPAGLWTKCPLDGEMVYTKDLEANWNVFPISGYHERLSTKRRIALLIDDGSWKETDVRLVSKDPLKFTAGDGPHRGAHEREVHDREGDRQAVHQAMAADDRIAETRLLLVLGEALRVGAAGGEL